MAVPVFKELEAGEVVLIAKKVSIGWREWKEFLLPLKVDRVTKTQFTTVDGRRWRRSDGAEMGKKNWQGRDFCTKKGYNGAKDETKEYEEFLVAMEKRQNLRKELSSLQIRVGANYEEKDIDALLGAIKKFKEKYN